MRKKREHLRAAHVPQLLGDMVAKLVVFSSAVTAAQKSGQTRAAIEHREIDAVVTGFKKDLGACTTAVEVQQLLDAAVAKSRTLKTEPTNLVAAALGGGVHSQLEYYLRAAADARKLEFDVPAALKQLDTAFEKAPELESTRRATAKMIGGPGHNDARITDHEELNAIVKAFDQDLKGCDSLEKVNDALDKARAALKNVSKVEALTLNPRLSGQGMIDAASHQNASALLDERLNLVAELRRIELGAEPAPVSWL